MSLTLRRATPDDAAALTRLMADEAVFSQLMQLPHPTEAMWRERLAAQAAAASGPDIHLVALRGTELVGSAGLHSGGPQLRRRHVALLGISVAAAAQGQGVGSVLMGALLDFADRWAGVLRIELTVYADNARAIALYERFGFVREGLMRAHTLRGGAYADAVAMARLHPNPPRLP